MKWTAHHITPVSGRFLILLGHFLQFTIFNTPSVYFRQPTTSNYINGPNCGSGNSCDHYCDMDPQSAVSLSLMQSTSPIWAVLSMGPIDWPLGHPFLPLSSLSFYTAICVPFLNCSIFRILVRRGRKHLIGKRFRVIEDRKIG